MRLHIPSFADGAPIPAEFAFGVVDPVQHVSLGSNRNPQIEWSGLPDGTRSLALLCHDPDVPGRPDDVNQEGRTVPADLERVDFTHWILVDIDPALGQIPAGADSEAVTPQGKPAGSNDFGSRGRNDYTAWFAGDTMMGGVYHGYDGPCPPWNDERLHHYVFTLYALDCYSLGLPEEFSRNDVLVAMEGHILDRAEWTGTYSLNPALA